MTAPDYRWDGGSSVATLDGEPLVPGRPQEHPAGWGLEVLFENGAFLYINCCDRDDPELIGLALIRVGVPNPDGTPSDLEDGVPLNTAHGFLYTASGQIVDEGIPGDVEAIMYHRDCRGSMHCDTGTWGGCGHGGDEWGDTIPNIAAFRRVVGALAGVPAVPSIWPTR